jgi:hypothetical protein
MQVSLNHLIAFFQRKPDPRDIAYASAPEPVFTPPPTMPEPNGFFPGINPEDFEDFDFGNMDFSNIPNYQMPAPEPENNARKKWIINQSALEVLLKQL